MKTLSILKFIQPTMLAVLMLTLNQTHAATNLNTNSAVESAPNLQQTSPSRDDSTAKFKLKKISDNINDTVITTKIKTRMAKDKNLNPLKISVTTHHGIVTLKGYAKNKQAFVNTLRIATTTKGVKSVDTSQLEIKRVNSAFADAYITAKVEATILEAKVLDDESIPLVGINASTKNGIVTLAGVVQSNKSVDAILKRVNKIYGVKKIISNLEVKT